VIEGFSFIKDAEKCKGYNCDVEGQVCPKGAKGASKKSYICKNKKWEEYKGEIGFKAIDYSELPAQPKGYVYHGYTNDSGKGAYKDKGLAACKQGCHEMGDKCKGYTLDNIENGSCMYDTSDVAGYPQPGESNANPDGCWRGDNFGPENCRFWKKITSSKHSTEGKPEKFVRLGSKYCKNSKWQDNYKNGQYAKNMTECEKRCDADANCKAVTYRKDGRCVLCKGDDKIEWTNDDESLGSTIVTFNELPEEPKGYTYHGYTNDSGLGAYADAGVETCKKRCRIMGDKCKGFTVSGGKCMYDTSTVAGYPQPGESNANPDGCWRIDGMSSEIKAKNKAISDKQEEIDNLTKAVETAQAALTAAQAAVTTAQGQKTTLSNELNTMVTAHRKENCRFWGKQSN
jgi:hypothetical protein